MGRLTAFQMQEHGSSAQQPIAAFSECLYENASEAKLEYNKFLGTFCWPVTTQMICSLVKMYRHEMCMSHDLLGWQQESLRRCIVPQSNMARHIVIERRQALLTGCEV